LEIFWFDEVDSTQTYLIEQIRLKRLLPPVAVVAKRQTDGVGSRDNSWEGGDGNLFFSFAIDLDSLPKDLPISSASIYFSFIMKEVLKEFRDAVWLKWSNDLYYKKDKIGGTVTKKIGNTLLCGMGVNLKENSNSFKALNLDIELDFLLERYFKLLETKPSWSEIFDRYKLEFEKSRGAFAHINGEYKSLKDAILLEDGSLMIDGRRVYSLR
jgi:BirA family biotin operon repressor/biotin-[acetyl-CoA-carboxylase] ligase